MLTMFILFYTRSIVNYVYLVVLFYTRSIVNYVYLVVPVLYKEHS